jgi:hypothetical protein
MPNKELRENLRDGRRDNRHSDGRLEHHRRDEPPIHDVFSSGIRLSSNEQQNGYQ